MADGFVFGRRNLTATGVNQAIGDAEGAGADCAGTGEVEGAEGVEVAEDGLGIARGEEKTDGTCQVGRELMQVGRGLVLGVVAEGNSHYFSFAKEKTIKYQRLKLAMMFPQLYCTL